MRALQIVDAVAQRALSAVLDDIAADMNEADRALDAVHPKHLLEGMEAAAVALADWTHLDLFDAHTAGAVGDGYDDHGHHDSTMVAFNNRMTWTLRLMPSVPLPWVAACQERIALSYVDRVCELKMVGRGGWA